MLLKTKNIKPMKEGLSIVNVLKELETCFRVGIHSSDERSIFISVKEVINVMV